MRNLVLAGIFLLSLSQHAYALFGDDEARKQIQELQKKTDSQNQATQDTIKKNQQALEQRIAALEAAIKGQGMLDLLNQIDRLNQELSNVKGQLEIANHNIDSAQQRQKDLYTDVDGRIRKLESGAPATSTTDIPVANSTAVAAIENAGEVKDYEAAQTLSRAGKHKEAFEAFGKFLQTYPISSRAPDAQYALGYAQFSLKNYNAAIATQQKLLRQFPDSPKAPDAAFNVANSQIQLADIDGAKKTLRDLLAKYPASEVAPKAKSRLAVLDSIKK
ncbi:MAG TPA: tol-pal system protein YbgF [Methylophilaceae bacterium]|nr:tol-pal system protein YbgF [Methylophilaceae bacterium]